MRQVSLAVSQVLALPPSTSDVLPGHEVAVGAGEEDERAEQILRMLRRA